MPTLSYSSYMISSVSTSHSVIPESERSAALQSEHNMLCLFSYSESMAKDPHISGSSIVPSSKATTL